jgi:hypothetical protein
VPDLPKIPRFDGLTPVDPAVREEVRRIGRQLRQLTPEAEAQRANERLASLRRDLADHKAALRRELDALRWELEVREAAARREITDLEDQLRAEEAWAAQVGIRPPPVKQPDPPVEAHASLPPVAPPDPQPPVEAPADLQSEETPDDDDEPASAAGAARRKRKATQASRVRSFLNEAGLSEELTDVAVQLLMEPWVGDENKKTKSRLPVPSLSVIARARRPP